MADTGRAGRRRATRRAQVRFPEGRCLPGFRRGCWGQGIASRGVTPAPRGKPSGIPLPRQFTDSPHRGSRHPVIYGDDAKASYIVETTGCGVAFFDYDNDGWLDILVLNGSRLEGTPEGTVEPALPQRPRRNLYRCHQEGRPDPQRLGLRCHHRRLQQRRQRRPVHHLSGPECALPEQRRRHLHRRHRQAGLVHDPRALEPAAPGSITIATGGWTCSSPTYMEFDLDAHPDRARTANCDYLESRCLRPARPQAGARQPVPQQRRRHVYRCQRGVRHCRP